VRWSEDTTGWFPPSVPRQFAGEVAAGVEWAYRSRVAWRGVRFFLAACTVVGCRAPRPPEHASGLAAVAAAARTRPMQARLARQLPHRPFAPQGIRATPSPEVVEAARRALHDARGGGAGAASTRAGVELWTGEPEAALSTLLDGLERAPLDAALWTDLSAVYLHLGEAERPGLRTTARALDTATRAVGLAPTAPEPAFNLALALSALGLADAAGEAWARAAALERDSEWRREAGERRAALEGALGDEWPRRRAVLLGVASVDESWLRATAEEWPQETRDALEDELLPAWGRAALAGNAQEARQSLDRARATAAHLALRTGDALLTHAVAAIDRGGATAKHLAEAHAAYGDGAAAYERTHREESLAAYRRAHRLLVRGDSPFQLKAQLQIGMALHQLGRHPQALARFSEVRRAAAGRRYVTLHGRAEWLCGLPLTQLGRIEAAVQCYRRARLELAAAGEAENVAALSGTAADTLRRVGEHTEGWAFLSEALARLPAVRTPRRRLTLLLNGSLYAADDGLARAALAFQDASLQAARERGAATTIVEGLTRRARLRLRAGDPDRAARDLEEASRMLSGVASPSLRRYDEAWLQLARAEWQAPRDPRAAVPLFEKARDLLASSEPDEVPRLSVGLGQAALAAGSDAAAAGYLAEGLRLFEARWQRLSRDQYRVSYLDDGWQIFDALIHLHAVRGRDQARGFEFAERGRARSLGRTAGARRPATLDGVRARLPNAVSLLYYALLDDRLLIWVIERKGARMVERPVGRDALQRQVLAYRSLIRTGAPAAVLSASQALHAVLIPPEVAGGGRRGPLAVVADGFLNAVPFATLADPRSGRLLVEERPVMVAPSAAHAVAEGRRFGPTRPLRGLFVGGSVTGSAAERAGGLPDASEELHEVARVYPHATLLENEAATLDALSRAVRGHDVLHFAAHAVANESFPWRSQLLLAPRPGAPDGAASLEALRAVDFSSLRLVVLSACRTASGPIARGEGVISLVRPFLEQQVPAVVGTLWDVDDAAARAVMTRFHAAYARSRDPIGALQEAQRTLMAGSDPALRSPRSWGAFIVTAPLR
jgi:CHAT domain-containing protein